MNIDFFTYIGPNSAPYAEYLKYTAEKFSSGKHNINWKCVESVGSDRLPEGYKCVAKTGDIGHNSMNHGVAINKSLEYVESDYVAIVDADMAIVYKNWDDVFVNELNNFDCFGVNYDNRVKYRNFPTVYFFGFRSYILKEVELDFTPLVKFGQDSPVKLKVSESDSKFFNMRPGSAIKCDTGWRLPLQILGAGYKANSMRMVLMTSTDAQLPFEDVEHKKLCFQKPEHMYEWHYKGKVFATHKQASRTQPLDSIYGQAWKRRIDLYMRNQNV
jgi:glycosyltransferase involved in cell wall biosynthesis